MNSLIAVMKYTLPITMQVLEWLVCWGNAMFPTGEVLCKEGVHSASFAVLKWKAALQHG